MRRLIICLTLALSLAVPTSWAGVTYNGSIQFTTVGTMGNFGTNTDNVYINFSAWVKSSVTNANMNICGVANTGTVTLWRILVNIAPTDITTVSAGKITVQRRDQDNIQRSGGVNANSGITDGTWHHIVVASGPTDIFIWIDGVAQSITGFSGSGTADNMANWGFGFYISGWNSRGTLTNPWNGSISDVYMWSGSAPTQSQVDILHNGPKGVGLQILAINGGYWPMNEREIGYPLGTQLWTSAGALSADNDYISTGGKTMDSANPGWCTFDATDWVQDMVANPSSNQGWKIVQQYDTWVLSEAASNQPYLKVQYGDSEPYTEVNITAIDDTYIKIGSPDSNYGNATVTAFNDSAAGAVLQRYDLSSLAGETIQSATNYIYENTRGWGGTRTIYRIASSRPWDESTVTWNAYDDGKVYNHDLSGNGNIGTTTLTATFLNDPLNYPGSILFKRFSAAGVPPGNSMAAYYYSSLLQGGGY